MITVKITHLPEDHPRARFLQRPPWRGYRIHVSGYSPLEMYIKDPHVNMIDGGIPFTSWEEARLPDGQPLDDMPDPDYYMDELRMAVFLDLTS